MSTEKLSFASPQAEALERRLERYARSEMPVLLIGHTGSGKEYLARRLHDLSPRRDKPFVIVPCNAIPDELFEAACFGYVKGAFTGATRDHVGYLGQAYRGTLFLDEVDKLPLRQQERLLRPLDGYPYPRLGSDCDEPTDVRLIAATNRDLFEMCRTGRFLYDLYGRIAYLEFVVPDTRERPDDVAQLARSRALELLHKNFLELPVTQVEAHADAVAAAARSLCAHPDAWRHFGGFREVPRFTAQALKKGIEEAADEFRGRWSSARPDDVARSADVSSQPLATRAAPAPSGLTPASSGPAPETLAGLIRSILHEPESKKPTAGSKAEEAMALARLFSCAETVTKAAVVDALGTRSAQTVGRVLLRLEEAGLLVRSADGVSLRRPLAEVCLFRLPGASDRGWDLVEPRRWVSARTGERFGIQVRSRLPLVLHIALIGHGASGATTSARPVRLVNDADVAPDIPVRHELVLDPPAGCEQLLIHLAWPSPHRGARILAPTGEGPLLPTSEALQQGRVEITRALGPGWIEEYWLVHGVQAPWERGGPREI